MTAPAPGERLHHLFEERCDRMAGDGHPAVAVPRADAGGSESLPPHETMQSGFAGRHASAGAPGVELLGFEDLDARANRLARHLLAQGIGPGDRVGLLFDAALDSYVAMLAVLKIHAAYVPLDPAFPEDRLAYIVADAGAGTVLTVTAFADRIGRTAATALCVDEHEAKIAAADAYRLTPMEVGDPVDELCYIIYTSGTTGRPKGVPIDHAAICNFVRVAAGVYGLRPDDRVYQGMTIAFDFSVEEIWVPLIAGATLVPKPPGAALVGAELREFLAENAVTALCCVPTLLATIDEDLPGLRFLLVSGEACPQDLVSRWHRPGRTFLNVYGPTEATVTATWTPLQPGRPVTIGVPLPTYSVVILDPSSARAVPDGSLGEIGIAGIGLSRGYLNRDDLTERAFIPDFLGLPANPSGRIYRTGDLGRINDDGEIEYHGRIDTQVKIRGYRIELTEIESALSRLPGIAQAVVHTDPSGAELVAYYTVRAGGVSPEEVSRWLRDRLPAYMVPAYLEELPSIPMLPSGKADRKSLPPPSGGRGRGLVLDFVPPSPGVESGLAAVLASVLGVERVSATADFFADLGANSLLMAHFCGRLRERDDLPSVSMKDIYLGPSIRSLVGRLPTSSSNGFEPSVVQHSEAAPATVPRAPGAQYVMCGALQLLVFVAYSCLAGFLFSAGYDWVSSAGGFLDRYLRAVVFGGGSLLGLCVLPIGLKWLLVGRWKPGRIRVWSPAYFRFWTVKTLIRVNPLVLFAGSPVYVLYLRVLGARIGRGVAIFSRNVPVCTDLLVIGDDTVIRKDCFFAGYRAHAGWIQTGAVTLGSGAFVGERTVIDIDASLGSGAQLGHASSLHIGQAVPAGECWHGSPARRASVDYRMAFAVPCGPLRRAVYGTAQFLLMLLVWVPLELAVVVTLLSSARRFARVFGAAGVVPSALVLSAALFVALVVAGLLAVVVVPRALSPLVRPGRVYPLYGVRYSAQRAIARITNSRFFMTLFGDSSYIVGYLRALGYDLSDVEQTGSNFGVEQQHESPYMVKVGTGTMVSDGLSMLTTEFSGSSFRVVGASIGARCFLGNDITYPPGARVGDNCLLGTKTMIPLDGPVRSDVGLLGSPPFEIPRSVRRDAAFDDLKDGASRRAGLAAKNRHNTVTIAMFLFARWAFLFAGVMLGLVTASLYSSGSVFGVLALAADINVTLVSGVVYFALVERAGRRFRGLAPRFCSIYQRDFWRHERFWKLSVPLVLEGFNGTPFKPLIWRLLGVVIARRVFDDGCGIPERTLVTIGDDCMLNAGSTVQCHSLEDGTFKSDRTVLGAGCTVGVGAFVHYGVTMGDGAVLGPDAFLMKGERVPAGARWRGNPAAPAAGSGSAGASAGAVREVVESFRILPRCPTCTRRRRRAETPELSLSPADHDWIAANLECERCRTRWILASPAPREGHYRYRAAIYPPGN